MTSNKKNQHEIFADIIQKIHPLDFRKIADLKNINQKLSEMHYLVPIIEEVLHVADVAMYGICKHLNSVYIFNGTYWEQIQKDDFTEFLSDCARKMGIDEIGSKYYNFKEKLFKQFMSRGDFKRADDSKVMINLLNGTFEFDPNGFNSLRPHSKKDFLTYQLKFKCDESAKSPLFEKFLDKVLPENELQFILAEYLGYLFVKNNQLKLEKMLFCYGNGSNGKSVLFDIVTAIFGKENVSNYSLQNLTSEIGYHRAKIADKLVNYASEISVKLEQSNFKLLSSGEPIGARLPYGEPFTIENYAKLIFNCNELPKDVEQTNAYFRRLLILPFRVEIQDEEKDTQLSNKIIENELPGVFNWILNGLKRLLENKAFTKSEIVDNVQAEYRTSSDSVLLFLKEENLYPSKLHSTSLKSLYEYYKNFCMDYGLKPVSAKKLADRLRQSRYLVERKSEGMIVYLEKF